MIWLLKENTSFLCRSIIREGMRTVEFRNPWKWNLGTLFHPDIDHSKAWGYFDGAIQGSPGICGSAFRWHLILIQKSLASILKLPLDKAQTTIRVMCIVDIAKIGPWQRNYKHSDSRRQKASHRLGNGKGKTAEFISSSSYGKSQRSKRTSESISFYHVFQELNETTVKLTKEALLYEGSLATTETNERGPLPEEVTSIHWRNSSPKDALQCQCSSIILCWIC